MNRTCGWLLLVVLPLTACEPAVDDSVKPGRQPAKSQEVPAAASAEAIGSNRANPPSASPGEVVPGPAANRTQAVKPNVIRWSTASEHDSFGYDIYRGTSEDGPFEVINPEVIPGAGTTDMPSRYEFSDSTADPGTTYWYYIESISLTGERQRITPVYPSQPRAAKAAPD